LTTIAWRFAHKSPSRLEKPIPILTVTLDYIVTRFGMEPGSWGWTDSVLHAASSSVRPRAELSWSRS
jgi:hypothetical protein